MMASYSAYATPATTSDAPWTSPLEIIMNEEEKTTNIHALGRDIQVEPTIFEGQLRVDMRHWTDGRRTKRGLSLPIQSWQGLINSKQHIRELMNEVKDKHAVQESIQLGKDVFVNIKSPLWIVDIRQWYEADDGSLKPGRRGVALRFPEFNKLMDLAPMIGHSLDYIHEQNN